MSRGAYNARYLLGGLELIQIGRLFLVASGLASGLLMAGCAPQNGQAGCQGLGTNTQGGAVVGAVAGAALANAGRSHGPGPQQGMDPISGAIIGGLAGGLIGNAVDNQTCASSGAGYSGASSYPTTSTQVVIGLGGGGGYAPPPGPGPGPGPGGPPPGGRW